PDRFLLHLSPLAAACGERHRPPLAAVIRKNAEAKLRLCRPCNPGAGEGPPVTNFGACGPESPSPRPSPRMRACEGIGGLRALMIHFAVKRGDSMTNEARFIRADRVQTRWDMIDFEALLP